MRIRNFILSCGALLLFPVVVLAQSNIGELRLTINDPSGLGLKSTVRLVSEANQYRSTLSTDDKGYVDFERLPYGIYQVQIQAPGFAQVSGVEEIRSALPVERTIQLNVAPVSESVNVSASGTLVDPYSAGSVNEMGSQTIQNRLTAIPGRSMQDLVNTEPGWLYEGNAVLHPRGAEYQVQFVIDGIPLIDNRSPGFGITPAALAVDLLLQQFGGVLELAWRIVLDFRAHYLERIHQIAHISQRKGSPLVAHQA